MNRQERDIMNALLAKPYTNQRILSEICGHSLGMVNRSLKNLIQQGYLDEDIHLTEKALVELNDNAPQNAIILAAGFGMRMVPINTEVSKGLIEIDGEPLIERLIKQLHEVGIYDIHIVVGFLKEQYEYLIDEYNVRLIVNQEYGEKNNLHSLKKAKKYLGNSYIIPCDVWCAKNPFRKNELYSWYMVNEIIDENSTVRVNRKMELVAATGGNSMIGISYITKADAEIVLDRMNQFVGNRRYDNVFWEECLWNGDKMIAQARVVSSVDVIEINTFEQLKDLDEHSSQLQSTAIDIIADVFDVDKNAITDITVLKKGMTNRSFLFKCDGKKYIMRIPGEGTDQLINRQEEACVYEVIKTKNICDHIIYMNPTNGYKITEYIENARVCDAFNQDDLQKAMKRLKAFHQLGLKVEHDFNIFRQIDFYESLWNGKPSVFRDYMQTKERILSLRDYIENNVTEKVLTHIDAVPDNFLFAKKENEEELRLIDWEYAGMQDPHVDIAMFCIYAMYEREQIENLIDIYFENKCPRNIRIKIYAYIAACGLLWSNWCEYKRQLGVDFGEYSLKQYRYAKEYFKIVQAELQKDNAF